MKFNNLIKSLIPENIKNYLRVFRHKFLSIGQFKLIKRFRWILRRPREPVNVNGDVLLHLGCGEVDKSGFINVDLVPHPHVHYLRPIDDLSNFTDGSVDLIYASHCLEHFSFRKVPEVLSEWRRVLKKNGVLRISVPDFDNIIETYRLSGNRLDSVLGAIVGGQDYKYNFHYVVFNKIYLTELLRKAGFDEVREWLPGSTELTTFDDWSGRSFDVNGKSIPISLNLEAVK